MSVDEHLEKQDKSCIYLQIANPTWTIQMVWTLLVSFGSFSEESLNLEPLNLVTWLQTRSITLNFCTLFSLTQSGVS